MITISGAQFEILVDGTPRSYRDRKDIAISSAEFLKHRSAVQLHAGACPVHKIRSDMTYPAP